jgi:hypothetical protein
VDLWEPEEPEDTQPERTVIYALRIGQPRRQARHGTKEQKALRPLAMFWRRLVQPLMHSSRTAKRNVL